LFRTVRAKLILTTTLVIAVVLAILGVTVDFAARSTMLGVIDSDLQYRGNDLARMIENSGPGADGPGPRNFRRGPGGPPSGAGPPNGVGGPPPAMRVRESRISAPVVLPIARDPEDPRPVPMPIDPSARDRAVREGSVFSEIVVDGEPRRVYSTVVRRSGRVESVVQLSYPLGEVRDSLARLRSVLLTVMMPVGILLAALASLLVVGRLFAPLKQLAEGAERLGSGSLSERLRVMGEDEFAALATTLNGMLGRIEQNFEQQRRFTADASHELKTPLTVIKANIGIVRHGKPTAEEVQASSLAIDEAADRMSALVRDLLVLARADAGRSSTPPIECDLREILHGAIRSVPGAERVAFAGSESPVPVKASPEDLTRGLVNLIDNALKYSDAGTPVSVEVRVDGGDAVVSVSDHGQGIAAEHLEHIFERFYRPDQSRTASSGGTGLGLAIAKGIVEMHGGTIHIRSEVVRGTTAEVRLPLA